MECQVCTFSPVVQALAELMRTYNVSIKETASDGSVRVRPVELNAVDAKIAREYSKRKKKDEVIDPLRRVADEFRRIADLSREQIEALSRYEAIEVQAGNAEDLTLLRSIIADYKTIYNNTFGNRENLDACIHSFVSHSRLLPELETIAPRHREIVESIKRILPELQKVCLGCSRTSNDDNLSNHGQIFVSIDAMAAIGLAAADQTVLSVKGCDSDTAAASRGDGSSSDAEPDRGPSTLNNPGDSDSRSDEAYRDFYDSTVAEAVAQSAHDYLLSHAAPEVHRQDPEGTTALPSHIEDMLRTKLAEFASLSPFEQLLCFSQWSGQSFSDFATMKWVPLEFFRPQSKQFITNRWNKLVEKFPLAEALKKTAPIRNVTSALSRHYASQAFESGDLPFASTDSVPKAPRRQAELF